MSKKAPSRPAALGANPRSILSDRGIAYEGGGFVPELPDYLGYVLGITLLWLLYTGYSSVVGLINDPNSKVSQLTVKTKIITQTAKKKTEQLIAEAPSIEQLKQSAKAAHARAQMQRQGAAAPEKGWMTKRLETINDGLHALTGIFAEGLEGLFSDEPADAGVAAGGEAGTDPPYQSEVVSSEPFESF